VAAPNIANLHIGTCAWSHEDWRGVFYPEHLAAADRLAFYARWFDAVEVDSTFYHAPNPSVAAHWAAVTPQGFRFSCKVPREITHDRRLRECEDLLAEFLRGVEPLGEKLACLLVQTPPWLEPRHDEHALRDFIRALPRDFRWAVEFRDPAWHTPRIAHLLEQHGAAWVWNDLSSFEDAREAAFSFFPRTADFVVVRLMGDPATKYRPDGTRVHAYRQAMWPRSESLENWAVKVRQELPSSREVLVFANNHFEGFSPGTAAAIGRLLGKEVRLPAPEDLRPGGDRSQMPLFG